MSSQRPLPRAIDRLVPGAPQPGDNLGLWLDRLLPRDPADDYSLTGAQRQQALAPYAREWISPAAREVLDRRASPTPGLHHARLALALAGRALPGAGSGTATEQSLSWHWLYGAPTLPGSALKGLARARALDLGWDDTTLDTIFGRGPDDGDPGRGARRGAVQLLDALPLDGRFTLALDGLTPHLAPWYEGEEDAPYEWLEPVPVSFLAITRATFVFDLLADDPALLAPAVEALTGALCELGVGGKTSAGYGFFTWDTERGDDL